MPRKFQLGFTLGRWKERPDLFGLDQIEQRLWVTAHPIGGVIAFGLLLVLAIGIPESRPFLLGAVGVGGLIGLYLWWRHR
jgi:hypothetical protein